jgi:hypothetical protein
MRRLMFAAGAMLALAACADQNPTLAGNEPQGAGRLPADARKATAPVGPRWSIFSTQTPDTILDATPGWEVGTRFRSSKAGKVIGFRFWRASGETGTNTGRLWTETGSQLGSASFPGGTGWVTVNLGTPVHINANTDYRVSVNTNVKQAKHFGDFNGSTLTSGPLTANSGFYGQPTGAMPTSGSVNSYFIDVIFEEDVPLPNLYVGALNPTLVNIYGQPVVVIQVCNNGPGAAAASTTQYWHWRAPLAGGAGSWIRQSNLATPALASGACADLTQVENSDVGYHHEYHVRADVFDVVYESNETDNYTIVTWNRSF